MCLVALIAISSTKPVAAQSGEERSLFSRSKRLMREGDFLGAVGLLEELAGRFPKSTQIDQYIFYRAKANYYLADFGAAAAGYSVYLRQFPDSPERAHAHFFRGNARYRGEHIKKALDDYILAYRFSTDSRLSRLVSKSIEAAVASAESVRLGPADFDGLSSGKRCELVQLVVDALVEKGDVGAAARVAAACPDRVTVQSGGKGVSDRSHPIEIALVVPLSGELRSYGEEIHNGALLAAQSYRQRTGNEISIRTYDTRGDAVDAANIVADLDASSTDIVIGPLTSSEAAVASAALRCSDLPMIAPAATEAGLTRLSESAFQLSPNVELQGVRMAEYAIDSLSADSAIVITSTAADHLRMSRAFVDRFKSLGGTVVAVEHYRARDKDFGGIIRDAKAVVLGAFPDSIYFIDDNGDTLELDGLLVHVDAIYMPGEARQIRQLVAQVGFYNLSGQYLGSDGWADDMIVTLGDDVTRMAVFPSPFLEFSGGYQYQQLAIAYDARFGKQPPRLAGLGFDAVNIAAEGISGAAGRRKEITEALRGLHEYEGASGRISFGRYRENTEMPLYRIAGGSAIRLDRPTPQSLDSTQTPP